MVRLDCGYNKNRFFLFFLFIMFMCRRWWYSLLPVKMESLLQDLISVCSCVSKDDHEFLCRCITKLQNDKSMYGPHLQQLKYFTKGSFSQMLIWFLNFRDFVHFQFHAKSVDWFVVWTATWTISNWISRFFKLILIF